MKVAFYLIAFVYILSALAVALALVRVWLKGPPPALQEWGEGKPHPSPPPKTKHKAAC